MLLGLMPSLRPRTRGRNFFGRRRRLTADLVEGVGLVLVFAVARSSSIRLIDPGQ